MALLTSAIVLNKFIRQHVPIRSPSFIARHPQHVSAASTNGARTTSEFNKVSTIPFEHPSMANMALRNQSTQCKRSQTLICGAGVSRSHNLIVLPFSHKPTDRWCRILRVARAATVVAKDSTVV